jgi:hypothetical protein
MSSTKIGICLFCEKEKELQEEAKLNSSKTSKTSKK